MTTGSDLVEASLRHLEFPRRSSIDVLAAAVADTTTTMLTVTDSNAGVVAGAVLEVDTELMVVRSAALPTVTVLRGRFGSTAATHASGAVVTVNPAFSRFQVLEEINNELDDLSTPTNGLFQVLPVELTYDSGVDGYNLTGVTSIEDVLEVRAAPAGTTDKRWIPIPRSKWRLDRNAETDDFASGFALTLHRAGNHGKQLRVIYKAPFTRLTSLAQDVQTVTGLPATANDIPPLGAAIRLTYPTEIARNKTRAASDARADERVPAGAKLRSPAGVAALRQQRIKAEAGRLSRYWVTRTR